MDVKVLRRLLRVPCQAAGSAALAALAALAVLVALSFLWLQRLRWLVYGNKDARELHTQVTMASQRGLLLDPKTHEKHVRYRGRWGKTTLGARVALTGASLTRRAQEPLSLNLKFREN
jgi:hypothetical protein